MFTSAALVVLEHSLAVWLGLSRSLLNIAIGFAILTSGDDLQECAPKELPGKESKASVLHV